MRKWLQVVIMLLGVVLFINSCNSLVSRFVGTHKLRAHTMQEVQANRIGDADFIRISGAWATGDFVVSPGRNRKDRPVVLYPVLSADQVRMLEQGQVVEPALIAWQLFKAGTDSSAMSGPAAGEIPLQGLVRRPNQRHNKVTALPPSRFRLPENIIYIEAGSQPLAWYWNLAMMIGAAVLLGWLGRDQFRRRSQGKGSV